MRIINTASGMTSLLLGRLGENERTQFVFDVADWLEEYPGATIGMYNQLPHSTESYPAVISQPADGKVSWTVGATELQEPGWGQCELVAVDGETVVKGHIWKTHILEALDGAGDAPDPWESWMTEFTALKGEAEDAAEAAEDSAEDAADSAEDAEAWAVGQRGGVDVGESDPTYENNAKYYAEEAGDAAAAAAQALIDDTAGDGDTDKVWSADKMVDELAKKYEKPSGGIPASDMAGAVQTSLGKADTAYQKPASGIPATDMASGVIPVITGKADKVASATSGNFAALDSNGNLTDSGHKHSDYLTQHQSISGKADKVASATSGNFAALDSNGNLTDSGHKHSDYLTEHQDISGKLDKTDFLATEMPVSSSDSTKVSEKLTALNGALQDIKDLTIDTSTGTSSVSLLTSATGKKIDTSTGAITDSSVSPSILDSFMMVDGAVSFTFTAHQRLSGENQYAFYSADTFAECGSSTLVDTVKTYTAAQSNTVDVPSGAKIIVIRARQSVTGTSCTYTVESAKADTLLADVYSMAKVYNIGDYCMHDGMMYRRTVYTGTYGAWDASKWEQTKPAKELDRINDRFKEKQHFDHSLFQIGGITGDHNVTTTIKYQVVNTNLIHVENTITLDVDDSFGITIFYYDSNDTYISNNGGLSTFDARTILKDSYVRLRIGKNNVYDTLSANDIPIFVNTVSYDSNYKRTQDEITENSEGSMNALVAKMYQKGGSPALFAEAPCILVAGQSNIDGRVPKANLPSSITPPFANIKNNINNNSSGTFADSMTLPSSFGIDFSLYSALNDLGTPWYIIKRSMGGTSISPYGDSTYHWTPFYENLDDISKSLLLTFNKQISRCEEANPNTFDFRALIWQQGEGDRASKSKRAALDYYKNFRCLVAYIRGITGNEKLPVVCGTVSHLSGQYDPIVEEATLRVAEEDPYMTCIDMSGATLLDSYHFDADCAIYFGYKAYDALIDFGVVSGTKINPICPWENT